MTSFSGDVPSTENWGTCASFIVNSKDLLAEEREY